MADRTQIMAALETALKTISVANGFKTDVGAKTYEWKEKLSVSSFPCVVFRDQACDISFDDVPLGYQDNELTVEITAAAKGSTSLDTARHMLADIVKCLHDNRRLGGLSRWITTQKTDIDVDHAEQKIAGVNVEAVITYRTEIGTI